MFKGYYRLANIITLIIAMLIASTLFIFTINQVSKIYAENTHQSIYDLKKSYLYDNVNNFILNIDTRLEIAENNQEVEINQVISFFNLLDTSNEALYEQIFESYYEDLSVKNFYDVILWKNDNIIYQTDETVTTINEDLYSVIQYGENSVYTFVMAVDHDKIESIIKDQLYEQIHASVYQYEAYIWVNEVINYDGGDNYAIRRVHPNAEEGVYLSTSMTDIKGNFPYLEELEGVKEDGDIFFTYYFKKLSTDEISEKLTYAKLYERFDWIIAMGIYIDETDAYIASVN
ncbi:MAG: cache domain-containing protein, partial [Acholeplasmataceae bacterium]|nr:cache domain-containing protein [Acholeplasmataceae bacterium]